MDHDFAVAEPRLGLRPPFIFILRGRCRVWRRENSQAVCLPTPRARLAGRCDGALFGRARLGLGRRLLSLVEALPNPDILLRHSFFPHALFETDPPSAQGRGSRRVGANVQWQYRRALRCLRKYRESLEFFPHSLRFGRDRACSEELLRTRDDASFERSIVPRLEDSSRTLSKFNTRLPSIDSTVVGGGQRWSADKGSSVLRPRTARADKGSVCGRRFLLVTARAGEGWFGWPSLSLRTCQETETERERRAHWERAVACASATAFASAAFASASAVAALGEPPASAGAAAAAGVTSTISNCLPSSTTPLFK